MVIRDILTLVGVTACLAGCFTLESASTPENNEHIFASNYGWYLFGGVPLVCGNTSKDAWMPFVFFRDDVTMDKVQSRFTDYARDKGATPVNINYFNDEDVLCQLPGTDIPLPIPYILVYREIQLSGVLK